MQRHVYDVLSNANVMPLLMVFVSALHNASNRPRPNVHLWDSSSNWISIHMLLQQLLLWQRRVVRPAAVLAYCLNTVCACIFCYFLNGCIEEGLVL